MIFTLRIQDNPAGRVQAPGRSAPERRFRIYHGRLSAAAMARHASAPDQLIQEQSVSAAWHTSKIAPG
jgi:hypothetical protein